MKKHLRDHGQYPGHPGLNTGSADLKKQIKGTVSYVPENHEKMVKLRAEKVERVANEIPDLKYSWSRNPVIYLLLAGAVHMVIFLLLSVNCRKKDRR